MEEDGQDGGLALADRQRGQLFLDATDGVRHLHRHRRALRILLIDVFRLERSSRGDEPAFRPVVIDAPVRLMSGIEQLVSALLDPASTLGLSAHEWNGLILAGRNSGLLSRLAVDLKNGGLFAKAP